MTTIRNHTRRKKQTQRARRLSPEIIEPARSLVQNSPLLQKPLELPPFDATIGKLVSEAFAASATGRLSKGQWESLAAQTDAAGFKLKEHLERRSKLSLASWNQQHSLNPDKMITTFLRALKCKQQKLRRGVLRRFYRAKDNYLRIYSAMSGS